MIKSDIKELIKRHAKENGIASKRTSIQFDKLDPDTLNSHIAMAIVTLDIGFFRGLAAWCSSTGVDINSIEVKGEGISVPILATLAIADEGSPERREMIIAIIKCLLDAGANPNPAVTHTPRTQYLTDKRVADFWAHPEDYSEVMQLLVAAKADPDTEEKKRAMDTYGM